MISKRLESAINDQINKEFWSAYLYLSMSANFSVKGKPGFANWMFVQFKEEQDHAMKFMNFLVAKGGTPSLKAIRDVDVEWPSALKAFEDTLSHERVVTESINNLYAIAGEEKDFATQSMLRWYIDEQVEEEDNARVIIDKLKLIKGEGVGMYELDKELAARVYVPIPTGVNAVK